MNISKRINWRSIILFLAVLGPGIITASVDNDAGGIATYSVAGANFGYKLLWILIPTGIALIIVQEMCIRMGIVTGKGLADLIRENYGIRITFYIMLGLIAANLGTTIAEFAGLAASLEIFNISKYISVPLGAIFVGFLVIKGSYRIVERILLGACVIYLSYIISGFLGHPDWGMVLSETIRPTFQFTQPYLIMFIALVGTTIAPWMQFYIQAAVVEKGVKIENLKLSRLDTIIGCCITVLVALFIIITSAATLFKNHISIQTAKDAALALQPLAGRYCTILFAIGLANASLFAASILPLSTAYSVCEGMGWEAGVDKTPREAPHFISLYGGLILIGAGVILIPRVPLISIMVISQVLNGVLLPFILIFMLLIINKKEIMGRYTNSTIYNIISLIVIVALISFTLLLIITSIF